MADAIEKLVSIRKEDFALLSEAEQRRLLAEANSALVRHKMENEQATHAPSSSYHAWNYRGGSRARGVSRAIGGYRGRGTYMPYPSNSRPQHLNRSARFNNGQAAPATTPNPNGGAKTNPQPVPASKSSQIGAVDPSAYNSATLSIAGETFRNPSDASIFERSGEVSQREIQPKAETLCRNYTQNGMCKHGHGCHFVHDDKKKAICREFLATGTCSMRCFLSHEPSAHNTPACQFFLRGSCTKESCRYAHVNVAKDAPVCHQFGLLGYCSKGPECPDWHIFDECPDYSNTGKCPHGSKCRLKHIAMSRPNPDVSRYDTQSASDESSGASEESANEKEAGTDKYAAHDLADQEDYVPLGVDE